MADTVIRVENLSKRYILNHQQEGQGKYKTLQDTIVDGAKSLVSTIQNPLASRRKALSKIQNSSREEFWAVKDVSFEIKQGDRVGIIGRNGAGKSTLLKLLSRIVEPTHGQIEITGRVASLLEVGTGFHPELTGRENIYLNGAILGMGRAEIKRKFDEIVAFAEVEKFLDTPVKRYSSGMYVRLAFAVAAHLEPEILIVDEVLAVGDSQFQQKCLGKMKDVAAEGRTVLFVSHSMEAIVRLTNKCILLSRGSVHSYGNTDKVVKSYLSVDRLSADKPASYQANVEDKPNYISWAIVHTSDEEGIHQWGQAIKFEFALCINIPKEGLCFSFQLENELQQPIFYQWFFDNDTPFRKEAGAYVLICNVPKLRLYMGTYTLTTWLSNRADNSLLESLSNICRFEVTMQGFERDEYEWHPGDCAYIDDASWKILRK